MTIIYHAEHITKSYGVTVQNNGCVKVQKFEDISNDENTILYIKPIETFLCRSQACHMTALAGAFDKSVFDGKIFLLKMSAECDK